MKILYIFFFLIGRVESTLLVTVATPTLIRNGIPKDKTNKFIFQTF